MRSSTFSPMTPMEERQRCGQAAPAADGNGEPSGNLLHGSVEIAQGTPLLSWPPRLYRLVGRSGIPLQSPLAILARGFTGPGAKRA